MHDQRANCVAFAPQWYTDHCPRAGSARRLESRPTRYPGINVLDVGQMDLSILAIDHSRHVVAADLELRSRYCRRNAPRSFADIDDVAPLVARTGDADGHGRGGEQTLGGF